MLSENKDGTKKISLNNSSDNIIGKSIYDIYREQQKINKFYVDEGRTKDVKNKNKELRK